MEEKGSYLLKMEGRVTMKLKDIMTTSVVGIAPEETAEVAARRLAHYNIGALPVCTASGKVCGMITDRDLVTRCMAANKAPAETKVRDVMTRQVVSADMEMDVSVASHLMGRQQIRRLPVTREGILCGMVSLADMACREESVMDAADALTDITGTISDR